jgi:hypothetical protein
MKITELIQPGGRKPLSGDTNIHTIWDRILTRHCTQAITAYRSAGDMLYRGMKTDLPQFRAASHESRVTRDSCRSVTKYFDQLLAECGMTALRSNSIFATSRLSMVEEFGKAYVIFPVDGFRFTYTNQQDMVLEEWKQVIPAEMMDRLNHAYVEARRAQGGRIWSLGSRFNWITDNVCADPDEALRDLQEISKDPWVQRLTVGDLFDVEDFRRRYRPRNHHLELAIADQLEVMIQGQYYAFKADLYGRALAGLVKR